MRKIFFAIVAFSGLLSFTNCKKEAIISNENTGGEFELFAEMAPEFTDETQTKTFFNSSGGYSWERGDRIKAIYRKNGSSTWEGPIGFYFDSASESFKVANGFTAPNFASTDNIDWIIVYNPFSYIEATDVNSFRNILVHSINEFRVGSETQTGRTSPMYGTTSSTGNAKPKVKMNHISTLLKITVTNNTGAPVTYNKITIKISSSGLQTITGYTRMNIDDFSNVTFEFSSETPFISEESKSTVNVTMRGSTNEPQTLADGESVTVYANVIPQTISSGRTLSINLYQDDTQKTSRPNITLSKNITLTAGTIKSIYFQTNNPALTTNDYYIYAYNPGFNPQTIFFLSSAQSTYARTGFIAREAYITNYTEFPSTNRPEYSQLIWRIQKDANGNYYLKNGSKYLVNRSASSVDDLNKADMVAASDKTALSIVEAGSGNFNIKFTPTGRTLGAIQRAISRGITFYKDGAANITNFKIARATDGVQVNSLSGLQVETIQ